MTEQQIREQIESIKRVSAEIGKSKEATLAFLIQAGILPPDTTLDEQKQLADIK